MRLTCYIRGEGALGPDPMIKGSIFSLYTSLSTYLSIFYNQTKLNACFCGCLIKVWFGFFLLSLEIFGHGAGAHTHTHTHTPNNIEYIYNATPLLQYHIYFHVHDV